LEENTGTFFNIVIPTSVKEDQIWRDNYFKVLLKEKEVIKEKEIKGTEELTQKEVDRRVKQKENDLQTNKNNQEKRIQHELEQKEKKRLSEEKTKETNENLALICSGKGMMSNLNEIKSKMEEEKRLKDINEEAFSPKKFKRSLQEIYATS